MHGARNPCSRCLNRANGFRGPSSTLSKTQSIGRRPISAGRQVLATACMSPMTSRPPKTALTCPSARNQPLPPVPHQRIEQRAPPLPAGATVWFDTPSIRASERHPHTFPRLGSRVRQWVCGICRARSARSSGCTQAVTDDSPPAASTSPRAPAPPGPVCRAASRHPEPWRAIGARMCWLRTRVSFRLSVERFFPARVGRSEIFMRCIAPHKRWDREGRS